ncbi:hypothetical protein D7V88_39730 [Corallococcus terminator]|uniref:Uncharacterized protein n=1 Tax=Corallococcus terminator TaxID=2316733 RepID=A0A3A8HGU7_9BACT|nr:hypothetical protein D7V88_39730 [Corallococcus terminator]
MSGFLGAAGLLRLKLGFGGAGLLREAMEFGLTGQFCLSQFFRALGFGVEAGLFGEAGLLFTKLRLFRETDLFSDPS